MPQPCLRSFSTLGVLLVLVATEPAVAQPPNPSGTCVTYFHIATLDQHDIRWNAPTPQMLEWWTRKGVPGLCYTSDEEAADYIVLWREQTMTVSRPYSVDVPLTISGGWLNYVNLHASRTPITTPMTPEFGTMSDWVSSTHQERKVTITVYRPAAGDALADLVAREPLFSVTKIGEWPQSKPDRDALAEAIKKLNPSYRPPR